MPSAEQLRDLHGIERRALAEIIGYAPQGQPVFDRGIFADAADISSAVANAFYRRDVTTILTLVDEHDARRFTQDGLSLLRRDLGLELDIDSFGMGKEERHANAGGGELDCRDQYLLGVQQHLPFFLGRSIVQEGVDGGDEGEGNLL